MIHHPIRFAEYKRLQGMNQSLLKHIDQSPAHVAYQSRQYSKPTDEMLLGSLADHLLFGTEFPYVIAPYDDWRTKEARQWRDDQNAAGIHVFKQETVTAVQTMVRTTKGHPAAHEIIAAGRSQVGLDAVVEIQGQKLLLKGLLDWVSDTVLTITDYKTTGDASPEAWGKHVVNMGYDAQAAWYLDLWRINTGEDLLFTWIVSESEPPHCTAVYSATDEILARGREINRRRLERYAQVLESGVWSGYPDDVQPLQAPHWAVQKEQR